MRAQLVLGFVIVTAVFSNVAAAADDTSERVRDALPRLLAFAESTLEKTGVPGMAIAVVHRDEVVLVRGLGVRRVGRPEVVDADTVFQLASVSKPIASTVVARLVGEGIVDWDDAVVEHEPTFRLHAPYATRNVTIRDLLSHRSGLPDHAGDLLEDLGYSRDEVLRRLEHLPRGGRFRADYAYTNFGFTAGAVAAAKADGAKWEDVSDEKLYRPLGMTSTSSRHADFTAAKNRVHLHVREEGTWVPRHDRRPDAQSPAGGVSSTANDLANWLRLQLAEGVFEGRRIVAAEVLAETHRPQIVSHRSATPLESPGFYGLGWNVNYREGGVLFLGHSGAFDLGAATSVSMCPAEDLGIVVLTNGQPIGVPEAVAATFFDLVHHGEPQRDWLAFIGPMFDSEPESSFVGATPPAEPRASLAPKAYVGNYANPYFGPLEVVAAGGELEMRLGPKPMRFALRHWDRDVFVYEPTGEMAAGPSGVSFRIGPGGTATSVRIEHLDVHGAGTFERLRDSTR